MCLFVYLHIVLFLILFVFEVFKSQICINVQHVLSNTAVLIV